MPRLVGTDLPANRSIIKAPEVGIQQLPDTFAQNASLTSNVVASTGSYLQQGLQQGAQAEASIAQDNAQAEISAQRTELFEQQERGGSGENKGLQALAGVGQTALQMIGYVDKRNKEAKKLFYDEQYAKALQEVSQLQASAPSRYVDEVSGRVGLEREFQSIMAKYNLSNSDKAKVYNDYYATIQQQENTLAGRKRAETDKIEEQRLNKVVAKSTIKLSAFISGASTADSHEKRLELYGKFEQALAAVSSDPSLTERERLAIHSETEKLIGSRIFESQETQAKMQKKLQNWRDFDLAAAEANKQYEIDDNRAKYEFTMSRAAELYGVSDKVVQAFDPLHAQKITDDIEKARQDRIKLRKEGQALAYDAVPLDNRAIGFHAQTLANDAGAMAKFENSPEGKSDQGRTLIAVSKDILAFRKLKSDYAQESAETAYAKQLLEVGKAEDMISYWNKLKPASKSAMPQLAAILESIAGVDVTKLQQSAASEDDDGESKQRLAEYTTKLGQAQAALFNQKNALTAALDQKLQSRSIELREAGQRLQGYGFDTNGSFDAATFEAGKKAAAEHSEKVRLQQQADRAQGYGGQTPNFRMPQLAQVNIGGRNIVLPFEPKVGYTLARNYGQDRGTHSHGGEDIAIPVGTKLISQMDGVVSIASFTRDPNGYGGMVEVKYADGSSQLMAHLSAIKVKEGDKISAGTVLGLSGGEPGAHGSGRSSGPHLHWEIRDTKDQPVNPLSWAMNIKNGTRGVRTADSTSSRPSSVPPGSIPMAGGYLVTNNGRVQFVSDSGVSSPVNYSQTNPIRANTETATSKAKGFGYSFLAKNDAAAQALNRAASKLNINAQWLADVIAHETDGTFDPGIRNYGGAPAVGIIQFYNDPGRNGKTIGGKFYPEHQIKAMSFVQQMGLVTDYLQEVAPNGIKSMKQLSAAIFTGNPNTKIDGSIVGTELRDYINQVGRHAGRKYEADARRARAMNDVHVASKSGCSFCANLSANNVFVPHQGYA